MDTGELRIFQTVAREGSINKAAFKLNYVQSNISTRIKQLEEKLDVPLFYRSHQGMSVTPAGERLLEYADHILSLLDEAEQATVDAGSGKMKLRLGAIESCSWSKLAPILLQQSTWNPELKIEFVTGENHALIEQVKHDDLDGALIYGPLNEKQFTYIKLYDDELVLVTRGDVNTSWREMLLRPLLFFEVGCTHLDSVKKLLQEQGIDRPNITEFGTLNTIINGVAEGLGISLLPRSAVIKAQERGELEIMSLPAAYRKLEVGFICRSNTAPNKPMQNLMQSLK